MDHVLYIGRFHPLLVHLPIGGLIMLVLIELFTLRSDNPTFPQLRLRLASTLTLLTTAAVICGLLLKVEGALESPAVLSHQQFGVMLLVSVLILSLLALRHSKAPSRRSLLYLYRAMLVISLIPLALAGHSGGSLTHGDDFLSFERSAQTPESSTLQHSQQLQLAEILVREHCYSCHGVNKQKGQLRLDIEQAAKSGGKSKRPAIVPGKPWESELVRRILLPRDAKGAMPPRREEQLTPEEVLAIVHWVYAGASRESTEPAVVNSMEPSDDTVLVPSLPEGFERSGLVVHRIASTSSELSVRSSGAPFDLSLLAPIADRVVELDLSRSTLTDAAFVAAPPMPNLRRLSLHSTAISDTSVVELMRLQRLQYLNLYGTRVSVAGVEKLSALPELQQLYVWRTGITEEDVVALRKANPGLTIVFGVEESAG